jgi:hypothetical protein
LLGGLALSSLALGSSLAMAPRLLPTTFLAVL